MDPPAPGGEGLTVVSVYVVIYWLFAGEGHDVVGVFSTRQKADDWIAERRVADCYTVEKWDLDVDPSTVSHAETF